MKNTKPVLALIAHDAKKEDMVLLVKAHQDQLADIDMVATHSTGQMLHERTGLPVTLMQSGSLGGDQQIGALVANDAIPMSPMCPPFSAFAMSTMCLWRRIWPAPRLFYNYYLIMLLLRDHTG
jgi:methylglyoxal synthase